MGRLLVPFVALIALLLPASAGAQSWLHPELKDVDDKAEEYSQFWEGALANDDKLYLSLVSQAQQEWRSRVKERRKRAIAALQTAAASRADKPLAFYRLGHFHYEDRQWQACAEALSAVHKIDPDYAPPDRASPNFLEYDIATCMLYGENYEGAIEHLKRIITLRSSSDLVEQKLGVALMALGRLNEAIEFLSSAHAKNRRSETKFILAVALDRAERVSDSRKELRLARDRDRDLTGLLSADKIYAPQEDEHYYLALAYGISTKRSEAKKAYARYHWRRYLALAPESPWRGRALAHLSSLEPATFAEDLKVHGHIAVDAAKLRVELAALEKPTRACLAGQPDLLLRVDLSATVTKPSSPWNIRATTLLAGSAAKEEQSKRIACVEGALRKLVAPKLEGTAGRHTSVHFSILGSP